MGPLKYNNIGICQTSDLGGGAGLRSAGWPGPGPRAAPPRLFLRLLALVSEREGLRRVQGFTRVGRGPSA